MDRQSDSVEIGEYWAILRRRKWLFIAPFLLVMGISVAIAYLLPPVYLSEATVLIERQTIPSDFVETTVTGYVQEQIQEIKQRIVTYKNLLRIAEQFDLYPEKRAVDPDAVVREMAENIEVAMVDIKATDPNERGERTATIAFTVSFRSATPETAKGVAEELTQAFLAEHRAERSEQAAQVSEFLTKEAEKLRAEIAKLEKSLADFKQTEFRQLPELMAMNLKLYERTEEDIDQTEEEIRSLRDRINAFQAELSLTNPYKEVVTEEGKQLLTASERLSSLTAQYVRASARYSAEHPDLIRMRREINILAREAGSGGRTDELLGELITLQARLREAKDKYSEEHPDVRKLEKAVAAVQKGLQGVISVGTYIDSEAPIPPDNPRYVSLKAQLDSAQANLRAEKAHLAQLKEKLEDYEGRLFQTPVVERDYKSLSRDYDNALKKYAELKEKQLQARLGEQLEASSQSQRFTVVDPARLPWQPESPNRLGIVLLGFVFAFGSGLGSVAIGEYTDRRIRGRRVVSQLLGEPPLAVIPVISDVNEGLWRRKQHMKIVAAVALVVPVIASYTYWLLEEESRGGSKNSTPPSAAEVMPTKQIASVSVLEKHLATEIGKHLRGPK